MDYAEISKIIGYTCHPLNDEGTIALIDIPFTFADGDDIPAYVEVNRGLVRFFDDGEVFDHFFFRGLFRGDEADTDVLSTIAASNGVAFTDAFKVEIDAVPHGRHRRLRQLHGGHVGVCQLGKSVGSVRGGLRCP